MKLVFIASACASVAALALVCVFLFFNGVPPIIKIGVVDFLFGREWSPNDTPPSFGILPMILGSVSITAGAAVIGVPTGILTACYMAYYCPKKFYGVLKSATQLLAGIPSVVYGFFGIVCLVPIVRMIGGNGSSVLTASLLLGIMILPTVIGICEASLRAVPPSYYDGAVALGASRERAIYAVVLPAAKSGVSAAAVLAIGRAIGETMAVIMVAGNQARMPAGLLKGVRSMTANIVIEMGYAADLHREALIATGAVLFAFILIINFVFSYFNAKERGA